MPLAAPAPKTPLAVSTDQLLIMFLLFVTVNSDSFVGHCLASFGGAVRGRNPTTWGVIVQGVLFVLAFCAAVYLRQQGVL
ncbi:MAG TPA: hypothetical protein VNI01_04825 [Elusimicrobiota bacterium]|nr:hypothetical protein [Elusimicrobiota bacterium]